MYNDDDIMLRLLCNFIRLEPALSCRDCIVSLSVQAHVFEWYWYMCIVVLYQSKPSLDPPDSYLQAA